MASSGFKNITAKTRQERAALKDKVALEKDRLMKRTGHEAKMYRENIPQGNRSLTELAPGAAGFLSDADRFHNDVSGEEYLKRMASYNRRQDMYDQKRASNARKEEQRWQRIESVKEAEETYWNDLRQDGRMARKNRSCVPYDTITLCYNDGLDGDRLRHADQMVRHRAALRSENLMRHGDTRCGYNILNGQDIHAKSVPHPPQVPQSLQQYDPHHYGGQR